MTIEEKAKSLEGRRIAIDASTATFKESIFVKATITEAVVTRTGCRHRLNFDDEGGLKAIKTDMLSLNDPKFAIRWLSRETDEALHHDEWPDLPSYPKLPHRRMKITPRSARMRWQRRLGNLDLQAFETVRSVEIQKHF